MMEVGERDKYSKHTAASSSGTWNPALLPALRAVKTYLCTLQSLFAGEEQLATEANLCKPRLGQTGGGFWISGGLFCW